MSLSSLSREELLCIYQYLGAKSYMRLRWAWAYEFRISKIYCRCQMYPCPNEYSCADIECPINNFGIGRGYHVDHRFISQHDSWYQHHGIFTDDDLLVTEGDVISNNSHY